MRQPRLRGRAPRTGHEEESREPLRFYVQIMDGEDLPMLIIPPKFVEVQNFEGRMVLGRGWEYFCHRHRIVPNDLVVLRIFGLGLNVQIYNHDGSIGCRVRCNSHDCIGGVAFAL
ncbi:Protein transport protein Sec31A [Hordeum vulgare]|nr:Protein transport protein Sec31A [Hordeum vulgare]